jgi:hypothetical protein
MPVPYKSHRPALIVAMVLAGVAFGRAIRRDYLGAAESLAFAGAVALLYAEAFGQRRPALRNVLLGVLVVSGLTLAFLD